MERNHTKIYSIRLIKLIGSRTINVVIMLAMILSSLSAINVEAKDINTNVISNSKPPTSNEIKRTPFASNNNSIPKTSNPKTKVLQATDTPTYYLLPVGGTVNINHPSGKYWAYGGVSLPTPANGAIIGIAFDASLGGNCPIFARSNVSSSGGTGFDLWGGTSDNLYNNTYLAIVRRYPDQGLFAAQIRDALVPGAIITNVYNKPANNVSAWAGYTLGWSNRTNDCTGVATASNFRWVVYGILPYVAGISVMSSCQPKNGPGDERECNLYTGRDSQGYVGDPINTRTGGIDYSWVDLSIPTSAGPLTFQRSYASLATGVYTTTLGYGWTHNQDIQLIFSGDPGGQSGSVFFKAHTTNRYRFTDNGSRFYFPYPGVLASLTRSTTQPYVYTLKDPAQNTYIFDASHKLQSWKNAQGLGFSYTYNANGLLERVADATLQRYLSFTYSGNRLDSVSDHTGRSVHFGYTNDNLTSVTDVLSQNWTYQYNNTNYTHHLSRVIDPAGDTQVRTEYDASGRAIYQYDGLDNLIAGLTYYTDGTTVIQNGRGYTETHTYDIRGTLVSQRNPFNETITKEYDTYSRAKSITNADGQTFDLTWSKNGATLLKIEAPGGYTTQMSYDSRNNLTKVVDPNGHRTTYVYNDSQDPTKVTAITDAITNTTTFQYTYDQNGFVESLEITDPLTIPSIRYYNDFGETISMSIASGIAYFSYDDLNRLETTTDPLDQVTYYEYDNSGQLIRTTYNYDPARPQNDANEYNIVAEKEYDEVGHLVRDIDTLGRVNLFEYDDAGRLIRTTQNYDANRPIGDENQYNLVTEYGYDTIGNFTSVLDANGIVKLYEYNEVNQLSAVVNNYKPGLQSDQETNVRTEYDYDSLGNLVEVQDANGHVTSYEYDDLSRLTREIDPLLHAWEYSYDAVGNLISSLDANGYTTLYGYDALNHLVEINYADDAEVDVTFAYNGNGWRNRMTDDTGTTIWNHDYWGRPVFITSDTFGSVGYDYDAVGNRTALHYPDGKEVTYEYDSLHRLTDVTDWSSNVTHYDYDAASRVTSAKLPTGVEAAYSYSQADRLVDLSYEVLTDPELLTDTLASYHYEYDPVGNHSRTDEGLKQPDASFNTDTIRYTYDNLYRLTAADYASGPFFYYTYDSVGNRLSEITNSGTTTYTYDIANRLTASNAITYTWDNNGNLLSDGVNTYGYDYSNRLTTRYNSFFYFSFMYNGLGDRIQQTQDGALRNYTLDLNNSLTQVLADGNATYLYGLGRIGAYALDDWQYTLSDALGSVRQTTDALNAVTMARNYAPFGAVIARSGGSIPFGFTGEASDLTDLVYLRARYYDPNTGRFLTKDPVRGLATFPQTLNSYVYALNNPVKYSDPSGEFVFLAALAVGAAGGLLAGLGYYAGKTYLSNDPCVRWDWGEALFWSGVGTGIGATVVTGGYGAWWIGAQLGLWGGISTGSYTVYRLIENGSIKYIGQTNNFIIRAETHLNSHGWEIVPIRGLQHLSEFDARAVEQALIESYGLANLYNKINSISPNNPIYYNAIMRGTEILTKIGFFKK